MKLYLASVSTDDVQWVSACGLLDGVLLQEAALETEIPGMQAHALEMARLFGCPLIVSTGARDADAFNRDARALMRETDEILFELPFAIDTVERLHKSATDGVRIAASMIFTAAQALLAAKAGAEAVLIHVPMLEAHGRSAPNVIGEIRRVFDAYRVECEIIAVSPRSASQVSECAASGADTVVLGIAALRELVAQPPVVGIPEELPWTGASRGRGEVPS
jgi:transaldolase